MQAVERWGFLLLAWQKSWVLQKCEKSDSCCICIGFCVLILYTVEPPNKGHLGTRASVLYLEVSFIRRLELYQHYRKVTFWCSESCPCVLYSERPLSEVPLYAQSFIFGSTFSSLAADIVEGRLEAAGKVGADVVINCSKENLKEAGKHALLTVSVCTSE